MGGWPSVSVVGGSRFISNPTSSVRLKLLSDMGFSYIPGEVPKVLIRELLDLTNLAHANRLPGNDAKSDVHTVALDNKRSQVYYANLIWSLSGE